MLQSRYGRVHAPHLKTGRGLRSAAEWRNFTPSRSCAAQYSPPRASPPAGCASEVELAVDRAEVVLDRLAAEEEGGADLAVGAALGDEQGDLQLVRGQLIDRGGAAVGRRGRRWRSAPSAPAPPSARRRDARAGRTPTGGARARRRGGGRGAGARPAPARCGPLERHRHARAPRARRRRARRGRPRRRAADGRERRPPGPSAPPVCAAAVSKRASAAVASSRRPLRTSASTQVRRVHRQRRLAERKAAVDRVGPLAARVSAPSARPAVNSVKPSAASEWSVVAAPAAWPRSARPLPGRARAPARSGSRPRLGAAQLTERQREGAALAGLPRQPRALLRVGVRLLPPSARAASAAASAPSADRRAGRRPRPRGLPAIIRDDDPLGAVEAARPTASTSPPCRRPRRPPRADRRRTATTPRRVSSASPSPERPSARSASPSAMLASVATSGATAPARARALGGQLGQRLHLAAEHVRERRLQQRAGARGVIAGGGGVGRPARAAP